LPLLSSNTSMMPWARSRESITEAPRSLKEPEGISHSHFTSASAPAIGCASSGVQPSPSVMGAPVSGGSAAR
jgi:hypothetical protein